jgi:hypothetical protein
VTDFDTNGNGLASVALSTLEALNVDDDFLSNLKGRTPLVLIFLMIIIKGD